MKRLQNTFKNSKLWTSKDKYIAEVSTWKKIGFPLLEIEIPGFYYDPEKKRYFKITKDYPGKKLVLCHCGGWKDATTTNHNRVIPSNIKVTKVSTINNYHVFLYSLRVSVTGTVFKKFKAKNKNWIANVFGVPAAHPQCENYH